MGKKKVRLIFTILVAAVLITFVFSLVSSVFAQATELIYPDISKDNPNGPQPPNEVRTLPNFIRYLFNFGIAIAGLAAFVSFVYGGVRYVTSAGNPGGISDAKDQIKASLLGLVLLLGSWLLLTTINPQLVILQIAKSGAERQGVILFAQGNTDCSTEFPQQEGVDFLRVKNSFSDLTNATATSLNFPDRKEYPNGTVKAIKFLNSSEEVGITIYPQSDYREAPSFRSADELDAQGRPLFIPAGTCHQVNAASGSVDIVWKSPGVYLFSQPNCKGTVRLFTGNTASMEKFDNLAQSLKIIPSTTQVSTPYTPEELDGLTPAEIERIGAGNLFHTSNIITNKVGVVLFQNTGAQGDGAVFLGGPVSYVAQPKAECINITNACKTDQEPYCVSSSEIGTQIAGDVSSLRVFDQYIGVSVTGAPGGQTIGSTNPPSGDGVTLFGNYEFNEQDVDIRNSDDQKHCGPINAQTDKTDALKSGKPLWVNGSKNFTNGATIGSEDNESKESCPTILEIRTRASSIRVDGDYIAVLFRKDGRAEMFKAPGGDYRLSENHIGDDKARYLLVIPIAPNSSENRRAAPPPPKTTPPPPQEPTLTLKVNGQEKSSIKIKPNESIRLAWDTIGFQNCQASSPPSNLPPWNGTKASSGNEVVVSSAQEGTYTFSLRCYAAGAVPATKTVTVVASAGVDETQPTVDLKINGQDGPLTFRRSKDEGLVPLTWVSTNADQCFGKDLLALPNNKPSGSFILDLRPLLPIPGKSYRYTIECRNLSSGKSGEDTVAITAKD